MKQTKRMVWFALPLLALVLLLVAAFGAMPKKASAADGTTATDQTTTVAAETVNFSDLPTKMGASNFDYVTGTNMDYKIMLGHFDASASGYGLTAFDIAGKNSSNNPYVSKSGITGLEISNWKWTFADNTSIVLVINAKADGLLDISLSSIGTGMWMDAWHLVHTVHHYQSKTQTLATTKYFYGHGGSETNTVTITEPYAPASYAYSGEVSTGDIVYYEVGCIEGRNIASLIGSTFSLTPKVKTPLEYYGELLDDYVATLDKANYTDENWTAIEGYVTAFKGGTYADATAAETAYNTAVANIKAVLPNAQTFAYSGLPEAVYAANYGWVSGAVADYTAYTGSLANGVSGLKAFDGHPATNQLKNSSATSGVIMQNWQWVVASGYGVTVAYRANYDCQLVLGAKSGATIDDAAWTADCFYNVYLASGTQFHLLSSTALNDSVTDEALFGTWYLKEGDVLYIEFIPKDDIGATAVRNTESPNAMQATLNAAAFDAAAYAAQDPVPAYITAKAEALNTHIGETYTQTDYSDAMWARFAEAVAKFTSDCAKAISTSDVDGYYTAATQAMTAIPTLAEEELVLLQEKLLASMNEYYASLPEANYTTEGWTTVKTAYETFVADYKNDAYNTTTTLQAFYDQQRAAMAAVKAVRQTLNYLDIPSKVAGANYGWVSGEIADFTAYTGNLANGVSGLIVFDTYEASTLSNSAARKVMNAAEGANQIGMVTWKWFVGSGYGAIVAYKANSDCKITLGAKAGAELGDAGWTTGCYYNIYLVRSGSGTLELIKSTAFNDSETDEALFGTWYLKAGDTLYIEFTTNNGPASNGNLPNTETPYVTQATFDSSAFDADAYATQNGDMLPALKEYMEQKVAELNTHISETYKQADYSEAMWARFAEAVAKFESDCKAAKTTADIDGYFATAKQTMAAVPTLAYEALVLLQEKLLASMNEYYASLVEANYTTEGWTTVKTAYEAFVAGYEECATTEDLQAFYDKQYAAMAAVKAVRFTFNYSDLPAAVAGVNYGWVQTEFADYTILIGMAPGSLAAFESYEGGNLSHSKYDSSKYYASATRWDVGPDVGVTVAYKANADVQIVLGERAGGAVEGTSGYGWMAQGIYTIYLTSNGRTRLVEQISIDDLTDPTVNDLYGTWYLKAGDTLYIEFIAKPTITGGSARNTFLPAYAAATIDSTKFDAEAYAAQAPIATTQQFTYLDLPTLVYQNNFGWVAGDVADVTMFTGSVAHSTLVPFDGYGTYKNDAGNDEIRLWNSGLYENWTYYALNWKWYVGNNIGVTVAYRANQDCKLELGSKGNDPSKGWLEECTYNVYIVRGGEVKRISSLALDHETDIALYGTWYLKEGDILYLEFISNVSSGNRNSGIAFSAQATLDATAFDEEAYIEQNHDLPEEVVTRIEEKVAALNEYLATLNEEDYSVTNWLLLADYIDQFEKDCETEVETVEDVDALYEATLADMQAVQTLEQAAAQLQATLDGYIEDLRAEFDKLIKENNYSKENREALEAALEEGIAAIRAAGSAAAGNTARAKAIATMKAVETSPKGLSTGAIVAIAVAVVAVAAAAGVAAVFVVRKKNAGKK